MSYIYLTAYATASKAYYSPDYSPILCALDLFNNLATACKVYSTILIQSTYTLNSFAILLP